MKILLSIKPEYAEGILNGSKRFEFRKSIFRNRNVSKVIMYATKPVGKIVGEFDIAEVIEAPPQGLWSITKQFAGIKKSFFNEYFYGHELAFAIRVENPLRYEIPLELEQVMPNKNAPQSFCYLPL